MPPSAYAKQLLERWGVAVKDIPTSDVQGKQAMVEGKILGHITGFQNFGAGELMELEGGMLVPVSCIVSITDAVLLNLPEGYLNEE